MKVETEGTAAGVANSPLVAQGATAEAAWLALLLQARMELVSTMEGAANSCLGALEAVVALLGVAEHTLLVA